MIALRASLPEIQASDSHCAAGSPVNTGGRLVLGVKGSLRPGLRRHAVDT
jgi:hypothetical protein